MAPDKTVVVDVKGTLPGRGVWVTAKKSVLQEAIKKRAFSRGFKEQVNAEEGLADHTDELLEQAALGALSMSRKAGNLIVGYSKVEASLKKESVLALVHATDASEDGVRKLAAVAASRFGKVDRLSVIRLFTSDQMSTHLDRENVIHAVLLAGEAGRNFVKHAQRLAQFRDVSAGADDDGTKGAVTQD
ncbi:protein containing DUF448 [Pseudovibrio sp. FO-BEG1]|nr:protein containing DUF448 [Pseudovibrio sp. FO-BEG1]EEA95225.1 conserved hypothetical protein [Pseudovibrio sp. JE062]